MREKCPYSELFWSIFSRIRTEYGKTLTIITQNVDTFYAVLIEKGFKFVQKQP